MRFIYFLPIKEKSPSPDIARMPHFSVSGRTYVVSARYNEQGRLDTKRSFVFETENNLYVNMLPEGKLKRKVMRLAKRDELCKNITSFLDAIRSYFGDTQCPMSKRCPGFDLGENYACDHRGRTDEDERAPCYEEEKLRRREVRTSRLIKLISSFGKNK